jgi:peptidoglycan/LPS O-acetylase OafA/YrhL
MVTGYEDWPRSGAQGRREFQPPQASASVHLDALRGSAAISVMYSHWLDACYANYDALPSPNPVLAAAYYFGGLGHAWVIVFFVLSGYLIGGSVLRALRDQTWSWRAYLLVRCTRLYVVLVPALLLGGAIDWLGMHQPGADNIYSGHSGMGALYFNAYSNLTVSAFVQNLLFVGPSFGSNGPLWSLSHEFWYYMAFPFLVFALSRQRRPWARIGSVVALLAWAVFVQGYKVSLFPVWLAGVAVLYMPALSKRNPWSWPLVRRILIGVSVVLLLAGFVAKSRGLLFPDNSLNVGRSHWHPPISDLLLSPIVALLIWVIVNCANTSVSPVYGWLAKRAAASSYTLYLVHFPALVFLKAFLHLPRVVPTWQSLPFNLSLLLIVFLYAQLVYWLFERNTDRVRGLVKSLVLGRGSVAARVQPV